MCNTGMPASSCPHCPSWCTLLWQSDRQGQGIARHSRGNTQLWCLFGRGWSWPRKRTEGKTEGINSAWTHLIRINAFDVVGERERESEFCNLVFREEIRLISSEINIRSRQQGMAEHRPQGRVWQSDSPFFAIIYRFQLSATRRLKQIALDFSEWLKILWTTMLMKY